MSPTGSLASDALTVAQKLTGLKDPYGSLLKELQSEGKSHFSWSEVKPWVGEKAALFITSVGGSGSARGLLEHGLSNVSAASKDAINEKETKGALLLDAKDPAKARLFLNAQAAKSAAHSSSYDGVSYEVNSENEAYGLVGHFAVIGSEAGIKEVIATVRGGASLAHASTYETLIARAHSGALANLYMAPAKLLGSVRTQGKEDTLGLQAMQKLTRADQRLYVSLIPSSRSITLDTDAISNRSTAQGAGGQPGAQMLANLPESSWLALGVNDFGESAQSSVQALQSLASLGGSEANELLGSLSPKSLDLNRDFFSWMGPAGLFVSGSNVLNMQVALVITSKNQSLSRAAVATVSHLVQSSGGTASPLTIPGSEAAATLRLKNSPLMLDVADGQGKFVLGLGEASITQALSPTSRLSASSAYRGAQSALGGKIKPSLILDFPTLLSLLEGLDLQSNPTLAKVIPYLHSLSTLTGGSERVGELESSRIILTLG